jgi:predicted 3-demethylubiquinone-9 3-methyltransferase (glyoxalase superfamily)
MRNRVSEARKFMPKVTPHLWFNDNAEAAMNFYVELFPHSRILEVSSFDVPDRGRQVISATFLLDGREYMVLNGGPAHQLNDAFSLFVSCETQGEVDHYWDALCEGGTPGQCGWLKDRFGVSWQIVPAALGTLLGGADPVKSQRVMQAMLGMSKLDVAGLVRARDGQ